MNEIVVIQDGLLESLGEFYCSEFVALHMPWIRRITFAEFVERELQGLLSITKG